MLVVLAAIDTPLGSSLVRIAQRTGLDKKSITRLIDQACEQAAVSISKDGAIYRIVDWGPVIKRNGAKIALTGALNAPALETS